MFPGLASVQQAKLACNTTVLNSSYNVFGITGFGSLGDAIK